MVRVAQAVWRRQAPWRWQFSAGASGASPPRANSGAAAPVVARDSPPRSLLRHGADAGSTRARRHGFEPQITSSCQEDMSMLELSEEDNANYEARRSRLAVEAKTGDWFFCEYPEHSPLPDVYRLWDTGEAVELAALWRQVALPVFTEYWASVNSTVGASCTSRIYGSLGAMSGKVGATCALRWQVAPSASTDCWAQEHPGHRVSTINRL